MSNNKEINRRLEAVVQSCSVEKMFLELSQNSQQNICVSRSGSRTF